MKKFKEIFKLVVPCKLTVIVGEQERTLLESFCKFKLPSNEQLIPNIKEAYHGQLNHT